MKSSTLRGCREKRRRKRRSLVSASMRPSRSRDPARLRSSAMVARNRRGSHEGGGDCGGARIRRHAGHSRLAWIQAFAFAVIIAGMVSAGCATSVSHAGGGILLRRFLPELGPAPASAGRGPFFLGGVQLRLTDQDQPQSINDANGSS
jgi:hypothetical protein